MLIDDATEDDISLKLANFTKKVASEKARYQQDIGKLEQTIKDLRAENELALNSTVSSPPGHSEAMQETLEAVSMENDEVSGLLLQRQSINLTLMECSCASKFFTFKKD